MGATSDGTVSGDRSAGKKDLSALEETIARFIETELLGRDAGPLDREENLFVSGSVDSVGIMRLIAHLEASLDLRIPPQDLVPKNFRSVRIMAQYLDSLRS